MTGLRTTLWTLVGCLSLTACGDAELPLGQDRDSDGWPEDLDCEDGDPSVFPAADEVPDDGIDQDCSGSDLVSDDGIGGSAPCEAGECGGAAGAPGAGGGTGGSPPTADDTDGDGHDAAPTGDDCDDQRPDVHPNAREVVLNGIDEDCDGSDLVGGDEVIPILSLEATPAAPPDLASGVVDGSTVLLAVWSDSRVAPGQDLYCQLLDASGEPIGPEIAIDTTDNAAKAGVRIASSGDGFLVTWATADGVWARPLAADGTPSGIALAFGGTGAAEPVPAFAGEHWAVAWRIPTEGRAEIRAMTLDGVRGDIHELGDGEVSSVSLAGTNDGFVAVWEGPVDESTRGILAQRRTITAYPDGEASVVFAAAASAPTVAASGQELLVAFSVPGSFGYAAAVRLGSDLEPEDSSNPLRLSSESPSQSGFRVAVEGENFLALWNDARHHGHVPPADSVYGNYVAPSGPAFPAGRAYVAGEQVQLGGVTFLGNELSQFIASVMTENGPGLFVVQF